MATSNEQPRQHKKLTIYDIKYRCMDRNYFSTASLKTLGITLKKIKVYKMDNTWYMLVMSNGIYKNVKYYNVNDCMVYGEYHYNFYTATATVAVDTMKG
jgi:hypothetical protein